MNFSIRVHDGKEWRLVELDDEEVARIQEAHEQMSISILDKCYEDVDNHSEKAKALFVKRCPSFIELINQKLESRAANIIKSAHKTISAGAEWMKCPTVNCGQSVMKYYNSNKGYRWYCGKCKKFKVKLDEGEVVPERFK